MPRAYREKQVSIRRLLLDRNGHLNADGRILAAELRRVCGAGQHITKYDAQGRVDPIATACAAQRREVFDHFVKLLHLEPYEAVNIREEE